MLLQLKVSVKLIYYELLVDANIVLFHVTCTTFSAKKDDIAPEAIDQEEEFKTLLEAEKERRLQELPKLRP